MKKNKKIIISISICIVAIILIIIFVVIKMQKNKQRELDYFKERLSNIFIYLEDKEYTDLNEIPDHCKISLIYGSKYLKEDTYLSSDDYSKEVKKNTKNSIKAYNKDNILKSLKEVLGNNSTINFDSDENGNYDFLMENGCGVLNKDIDTLNYNSDKEYVFSITDEEKNDENIKLFVKWDDEKIEGNTITLNAYALMTRKRTDGSYEVFADGNLTMYAGEIGKDEDLNSSIEKMYVSSSRRYSFKLKKNNNKYSWIGFDIKDDIYNVQKDYIELYK